MLNVEKPLSSELEDVNVASKIQIESPMDQNTNLLQNQVKMRISVKGSVQKINVGQ